MGRRFRVRIQRLRRQRPGTETLERLKRWPSLRKGWEGKQVRIWSAQWDMYWRDGGNGYTSDGLEAGVFMFEDAFGRTRHCGPEKQVHYRLVEAPQ